MNFSYTFRKGLIGTKMNGTNMINGVSTYPNFPIKPKRNDKGAIINNAVTLSRNNFES